MKRGFIPSTLTAVEIVSSIEKLKDRGVELENIVCNSTFDEFLERLSPNDEVHLLSFSTMDYSMSETMAKLMELSDKKIDVFSIDEPALVLSAEKREFFLALSNLESKIRTIRTKQGLNKAKADGKKLGRPLGSTTTDTAMIESVTKYREAGMSVEKACKLVGCEPRTYYRHLEHTNF